MRRPVFLALLAALLPACAATEEDQELSRDKVVLTQGRGEPQGEPAKPAEWFEAEIETATRERKEGFVRKALERVYAAKQENPAKRHLRLLNELLNRLHRDVLELDTIEAWIEVDKDPVVFGEPLRLRVHLKNGTQQRISIPASLPGASSSLFVLTVLRRNYDVRAHVSSRLRRITRALVAGFDIAPGASAEQVVIIDGALVDNDKPLDGFRTFTVGGVLRPVVIEIGGLRRWETIRIRPGMLRSFRPNYEHLADDPLERIGQAIRKQAPVHLLTACALLPLEGRQAAVDRMVGALRGDRRIDWAMFAALQYLTNVELGRDAGAWRAWWPRVRANYFEPPPPKKPKDVPVFD